MKYLQVLQIFIVIGLALSASLEETDQNDNEIIFLTTNELYCYQCTNNSKAEECSCEGSKCLIRTQGNNEQVSDRRCTDERWVHELLYDGCLSYKNETWCVCSSNYCNGADVKSIRGDDDCSTNPCPSGSICLDTREGFKCMCPPWQKTCTYQAQADCPCENNGMCVRLPSGNIGCSCSYGFSGQFCQNRDPCAPNPCMNSGMCQVFSGFQPQCACRQGFQGDLCQVCDACSPNPCNNGGNCLPDGLNGFICKCQPGTNGRTCDQQTLPPLPTPPPQPATTQPPQNPCVPNPCNNGGYGIPYNGQCYCQCTPQYSGPFCEVFIPPATPAFQPTTQPVIQTTSVNCQPDPCWNGGHVINQNNNCFCECPPQYDGPYCEQPTQPTTLPTPPPTIATPPPIIATPQPTLPPYIPPQTTRVICQPNPCWNGGQVINQNNNCYCQCPPEFTGSFCHQPSPQPPQQIPPQTQPPFVPLPTPPPTTRPQNPCQPNPCYNGGYGIPFGNQCYCQCPPQYTGQNCAQFIQPTTVYVPPPPTLPPQTTRVQCTPNFNPCWNGGQVINKNNNCYCQCPPNFNGQYCQQPTPAPPTLPTLPPTPAPTPSRSSPCQPNPCQHNGYPIPFQNQCYCQCIPQWTGPQCQTPITTPAPETTTASTTQTQPPRNPCDPDPCQNGARPIPIGDQCVCQCLPNFTGQYCDVEIVTTTQAITTQPPTTQPPAPTTQQNPCQPSPCQNNGYGVPFGDNCYCICLPIYTGNNCQFPIVTLPPQTPPQTLPPFIPPPPSPQPPQQWNNPCTPNPCWNGGSCYNYGQNQCACACPPRYTGQYCNQPTPAPYPQTYPTLPPLPPQRQEPQQPQQPQIQQQWYNPCQPNPCANYGRCVPQGWQYQCACGSQWSGQRCDIRRF